MLDMNSNYCVNILLISKNLIETQKIQKALLETSSLEFRLHCINDVTSAVKLMSKSDDFIDIIILDKRLLKNLCDEQEFNEIVSYIKSKPVIFITSEAYLEKIRKSGPKQINYPVISRSSIHKLESIIRNIMFPERNPSYEIEGVA